MSERALIIEDDEDLANIFAEALRGVGFEVELVADGEVAEK
jgi:DNA-binding response OmpR family regulator